jgi:hypothetical protein
MFDVLRLTKSFAQASVTALLPGSQDDHFTDRDLDDKLPDRRIITMILILISSIVFRLEYTLELLFFYHLIFVNLLPMNGLQWIASIRQPMTMKGLGTRFMAMRLAV